MAPSIHLLSEITINQIAAGEVIENPASVVKELIENSIDAHATRITIEIEDGGFQTIRVSDNGKGMHEKDLLLSIARHATSKIQSAEDLDQIFSMGFRGEALASIASISKMTLISSQGQEGASLYAEAGIVKKSQPQARSQGTTAEVKSLFYNVPARKKFQKSSTFNQSAILKIVTRLSLAHAHVEMQCICDGKEKFSSFMKRSDQEEKMMEEVIQKVLGTAYLEGAFPVNYKAGNCEIRGFLGEPQKARINRSGQYLFVNERAVDSPELLEAVYEGYGTRLSSRDHPAFFLHFKLPPHWVDVNVHPQKREIRLREKGAIHECVRQGVITSLKEKGTLHKPTTFQREKQNASWMEKPALDFRFKEEREESPSLIQNHLPIIGLYSYYLIVDASFSPLKLKEDAGVIWIDLQAAEARIVFEVFLKRFTQKQALQTLLFPITFECSIEEKNLIELHLETFQTLGIDMRPFGNQAFVVDALDAHLDETSIPTLVFELLEILENCNTPSQIERKEQKKLALHLLRFVRSEQKEYTEESAREIVKRLLKTEAPYHSPIGQPTCIHMSQNEIKNAFS